MIPLRRPLAGLALVILVPAAAGALEWERITVNGYVSFEIEQQIEPAGEGAGDPNGSFDADLFDLVLNFQVSDRIRAAVDITWEHGAASEDNRGNVALEYGFVEYTVSDLLRVRIGKMLTPFGVFNQIHTAKPAFLSVKEASSTNKPDRIVEDAERFFPRFGTGVALQGDGDWGDRTFDYDLFLANGDQEETNPFEKDNNSFKSITGRLRVDLTGSLQAGVSLYHDRFDNSALDSITSAGLQLEQMWTSWRLLAEVVAGRRSFTDGGSSRQLAWFVQPSYTFSKGTTPYLRYEWVDPDTDAAGDDGVSLILGVNHEVARSFMLKLENDYFRGGRASSLARFPSRDYNEIKAAVVLGF